MEGVITHPATTAWLMHGPSEKGTENVDDVRTRHPTDVARTNYCLAYDSATCRNILMMGNG